MDILFLEDGIWQSLSFASETFFGPLPSVLKEVAFGINVLYVTEFSTSLFSASFTAMSLLIHLCSLQTEVPLDKAFVYGYKNRNLEGSWCFVNLAKQQQQVPVRA